MSYIGFLIFALATLVSPTEAYAARSGLIVPAQREILLDSTAASALRQELGRANPGVHPHARKMGPSKGGARDSKAAPAPNHNRRFYAVDEGSVYQLELSAGGENLRVLKQSGALPKKLQKEIIIDLKEVEDVRQILLGSMPATKKPSGGWMTVRPKSRTSAHKPSKGRRHSGSGSYQSAPRHRAPAGGVAGLTASQVAAEASDDAASIISAVSGGNAGVRLSPAYVEDLPPEAVSRLGIGAPVADAASPGRVPLVRQSIEQVARNHIDRHAPEEAYEMLVRSGVPLDDFSHLKDLSRFEDLSSHVLLIEAAVETGRFEQALKAIDTLVHGQFYDAAQNRVLRAHFDPTWGTYSLRAQAPKATFHPDANIHLLHARATMAVGNMEEGLEKASSIIAYSRNKAMVDRAKALFAEAKVRAIDQETFLAWGDDLLASPHLSASQKDRVAYRLGEVHLVRRDTNAAATYFKQIVEQADPYTLPWLLSGVTKDKQQRLVLIYDLLYQKQLPYAKQEILRKHLYESYGIFANQKRILAAETGPHTEKLAHYLKLEEAHSLLKYNQPDEAVGLLDEVITAAQKGTQNAGLLQAGQRYKEMAKLQKVRGVAERNPGDADKLLRKVLDKDSGALEKEHPLMAAHYFAQRSMVYSELGNSSAAIDDLWQILLRYHRQPDSRWVSWNRNLYREPFEVAYKTLISKVPKADLPPAQQHQLELVEASVFALKRPWDLAAGEPAMRRAREEMAESIEALQRGLDSGAYSREQQAFAELLQAKFYQRFDDRDRAIAAYRNALYNEAFLPLPERAHAHLGIEKLYYQGENFSDAVHHLKAALQGALSLNDAMAARTTLAYTYIASRNKDLLPDAIELLSKALKHEQGRSGLEASRARVQQMHLQMARALDDYGSLQGADHYTYRSLQHYREAEKLSRALPEKLGIMKERADRQFQAYMEGRWDAAILQSGAEPYDIIDAYQVLIQDSSDHAVRAQAYMNLGDVHYKRTTTSKDLSTQEARSRAYLEARKHYEEAEKLRASMSVADQAKLDFRRARVLYESWGRSWPPVRVQDELEPLVRRALESNTLQGKDVFRAYEYLGAMKLRNNNYSDAYEAYTYALAMSADASSVEKIWIHKHRADVLMAQKRFGEALEDYEKIFRQQRALTMDIDIQDYYKLYLERAKLLQPLGRFEEVLDDLDRLATLKHEPVRSTVELNELVRVLMVDQFLAGNTAGTARVRELSKRHVVIRVPDKLAQVLDAAVAVEQKGNSKNLKALRVSLAGVTDDITFNERLMSHQRKPLLVRLHQVLGEGMLKKHKYPEAQQALTVALEQTGRSEVALRSQLNTLLAQSAYGEKNYVLAAEHLGQVVPGALDASFQKKHLGLQAHLARNRKDYTRAIEFYEAADAIDGVLHYAGDIKRMKLKQRMTQARRTFQRHPPHEAPPVE